MKRHRILARAALIAMCLCPLGCAQLEALQAKPAVQFAELETLKLVGAFFDHGGSANALWGASMGMNVLGDYATFRTQSAETVAANAKAQVKAFAGDPTAVNGLATGVANIITKAAPKTAADKAAIVTVIANTIGKGAAAVAAP